MSQGKKSKSTKPQKLSLHDFLGPGDSWADVDADLPAAPASAFEATGSHSEHYTPPPSKAALGMGPRSHSLQQDRYRPPPSGPGRASRNPLPDKEPFTAYVGQLPFSIDERRLHDFFKDAKEVRLLRDKIDNRPRGIAYVEFKTVEGLAAALDLDGTRMENRQIRVDVAEPRERAPRTPSVEGPWRRESPVPQSPRAQTNRAQSFSSRSGSRERVNSFAGRPQRSYSGVDDDGKDWAALRRTRAQSPASLSLTKVDGSRTPRDEVSSPLSKAPLSAGSGGAPVPFSLRGSISGSIGGPIGVVKARPKVNPFGEAKPRDENLMQKQAEERYKTRHGEDDTTPSTSPDGSKDSVDPPPKARQIVQNPNRYPSKGSPRQEPRRASNAGASRRQSTSSDIQSSVNKANGVPDKHIHAEPENVEPTPEINGQTTDANAAGKQDDASKSTEERISKADSGNDLLRKAPAGGAYKPPRGDVASKQPPLPQQRKPEKEES